MAKSQLRSHREAKKPKKIKPKTEPVAQSTLSILAEATKKTKPA